MTYSLNGNRFSDQLERVKRYLVRVRNHNRPHAEYEDDLWSFFVHAWALKDWVRNDKELNTEARARVAAAAENEFTLQICADLANRTKHVVLDKHSRHDARPVRRDVAVGTDGRPSLVCTHHIALRNGETVIAQELAGSPHEPHLGLSSPEFALNRLQADGNG
jgi:hypothetical protein